MSSTPSLIITTYNRPDALDAVLRAVARQSLPPAEVLIADDGSGGATADIIGAWQARLAVPLRHVWQEDRGFRAAEVRNRALAVAAGDLVVFLDGDCLPRRDFIARHAALAEPGYFVAGHRLLLSQRFTAAVLAHQWAPETWSLSRLAYARLSGRINRLLPVLNLPDGGWRRRAGERWEGVRTCNLAVWRRDLLRVDGLDSAFQGWGLEDSDLAIRLLHAGVRRKDGRFSTGVLHLWHDGEDRSAFAANRQRLEEVLISRRILAEQGISTLDRAHRDIATS